MPNHTITDTMDNNILTAEEFHRQARRWAATVRNAARRNTLRFTKGKKVTSITKKSGQWSHVLIDQGYLPDNTLDKEYLRWMYTAVTRGTEKVYLLGFNDEAFDS